MERNPLLPLPNGMLIDQIQITDAGLLITVVATHPTSCCPLCSSLSSSIHSTYSRMLQDVPCGGRQVQLVLTVRKFFCHNALCQRKVFTERLPQFAKPWARMTIRLVLALQSIGSATSGNAGKRLAERLSIQTSRQIILRRIMDIPSRTKASVLYLGLDDFSFRRGYRYGTICVDLESHRVIDVLPDRRAETVARWMCQHPDITVVSRDRGGEYASAATLAAPQAIQVADRFHLYRNLVEAVELILARCRAEIRKNAQAAAPGEQQIEGPQQLLYEHAEVIVVENWKPEPEMCDERARLARRAQRYDRYQQVMALYEQGLGFAEIARHVGLSRRTTERWIKEGEFPEAKRRRKRRSVFDPYAAYVLARWEQGCTNGLQLYQEIQAQGYCGSAQTIYRYLRALRKKRRVIWRPEVPQAPLQDFSAHEAVWLFARDPEILEEKEQTTLTAICQASETARTAYQLIQEFRHLLHQREGEKLDAWLAKCTASQIPELQSFVFGVGKDKAAVQAGLTYSINNGMVEGHVTKLKLIKRQMYGKAGFALLRQRVLHAV